MKNNRLKMMEKTNSLTSSKLYIENKCLAMGYQMALVIINKMLPDNHYENDEIRLFIDTSCTPDVNTRMHSKLLKHRIVEIHSSLHSTIAKQ